jgi:hypothetical protein
MIGSRSSGRWPPARAPYFAAGQEGLHRGLVHVGDDARRDRRRDHVRWQVPAGAQHRRAGGGTPAADQRRVRLTVEQVLDGQLDERPLFLHHHDLVQAAGELADDARLER